MIPILLFHHALGLTEGIVTFADRLRSAGHVVVTPDLFGGRVFASIDDGVAHAQSIGFDVITDCGVGSATSPELGDRFVTAGFSLGAMPAQKLAQTDTRVAGAILYHGVVPPAMLAGGGWPDGLALQMHMVEHDPWADEDLPVARALAEEGVGELVLHPGTGHLPADSSYGDYDPEVAERIVARSLEFLAARS
jgi:dienelactone hydrolase